MRKIIAGMFITLDGVVETPEQWNPPHDYELNHAVKPALTDAGLHMYERRSYELFCTVFTGRGRSQRPSHAPALRAALQFVRTLTNRNGKYEVPNGEQIVTGFKQAHQIDCPASPRLSARAGAAGADS